jgi:hypothetical protein
VRVYSTFNPSLIEDFGNEFFPEPWVIYFRHFQFWKLVMTSQFSVADRLDFLILSFM